jgi:uncharacterized protein DUF4129
MRAAQQVDPNSARDAARNILSGGRFHSRSAPRPLRGPLQWIGDRLKSFGHWLGHVFSFVPGWVWLGIGVIAVAALVTRIVLSAQARRVTLGSQGAGSAFATDGPEDPDALEREADAAERDGDLARAVRLRFRAGLIRLGKRGAITYRPSVTTGEVQRVLGSDAFDELAHTFEGIAYGGQPAAQPDVDSARRTWPRVLDEAGRK